jgi:hypothetical protein
MFARQFEIGDSSTTTGEEPIRDYGATLAYQDGIHDDEAADILDELIQREEEGLFVFKPKPIKRRFDQLQIACQQ